MFGSCPVVRIKYDNPEGFCEINESDFDPEKHEMFGVEAKASKAGRKSKVATEGQAE
jgi:hypothetical protein